MPIMWKGFLEEVGYGATLKQIQIRVPGQQILKQWPTSERDGWAPHGFWNGPRTSIPCKHTPWGQLGNPYTKQHKWGRPITISKDCHHASWLLSMSCHVTSCHVITPPNCWPCLLNCLKLVRTHKPRLHAYLPMKRVQIWEDWNLSWHYISRTALLSSEHLISRAPSDTMAVIYTLVLIFCI